FGRFGGCVTRGFSFGGTARNATQFWVGGFAFTGGLRCSLLSRTSGGGNSIASGCSSETDVD
ncbi:hypothetical protein A2U01_0063970, partial [Trifolium medium]|nr:hypothetical protein [Trifolium medium]